MELVRYIHLNPIRANIVKDMVYKDLRSLYPSPISENDRYCRGSMNTLKLEDNKFFYTFMFSKLEHFFEDFEDVESKIKNKVKETIKKLCKR